MEEKTINQKIENEKTQEAVEETTSEKPGNTTETENAGDQTKTNPSATDKVAAVAETTRKENDRKEKLLEREEKLIERKENLAALGGGSPAGKEEKPGLTEAERASRNRIKAVGLAGGATWAKNMDKEDGAK